MISRLELLTDLYNHRPGSRAGFLKSLISGTRIGSVLKRLHNYYEPQSSPMKSPAGDLRLNLLNTRERAPLIFSDQEIAVYTVLFGAGDKIRDPLIFPDNIHYFVITDQDLREDCAWRKLDVSALLPEEIRDDPVLCNRWCKMHPDLLFPDHDVSVYLDANIFVTSDLTPLTAGLEQFPVTLFRHRTRDCAYQEIRACRVQKKAPLKKLMQDKERLKKRGLPEHWGLLEAPVIARRHHDPLCRRIMDEWWKDFCESASRRDQIALMDCLWQLQIPPERIGILGSNVRTTQMFIQLRHEPARKKVRAQKK